MYRSMLSCLLVLGVAACSAPPPVPQAAEQGLPAFKLPAATPSSRMNLAPQVFGAPMKLGDVEKKIARALRERGYPDINYYAVPDGFAMATEIERIKPDGAPFPEPERWKLAAPPLLQDFSLRGLLDRLRQADVGHYRVIVFVVTTRTVTTAGPAATFAQAQGWTTGGGDFLPATIADKPLTAQHNISLLVYEFARASVGAEPAQVNGLTAEQHLKASRLLR